MDLIQLHRLATKANVSPLLGTWRRLNDERPVTIVMYHSISPDGGPWTISPHAFERQIRFLSESYRIIPLRNIAAALVAKDSLRRVVISFDDAYRNFVEHAYPVLESLGVACTMFVPTAHIGKFNQWDAGVDGARKLEIMEATQLRQIAKSPQVDIGSHTIDHCRMGRLSAREMRRQAAGSRTALEQLLERNVVLFAYPWGQLGDFSNLSTQVLAETGYKAAVTTRWGSTNSIKHVLALRRIFFEETDSIADLRAKVEGDYDWFALKEWAGYTKRRLGGGRA
jgi:peptidoglycan/xylan/chitin deacetylase (PgdA/CDA1 family)